MIPNFIPHKVFLGALPKDATYSELFKLASSYGEVRNLKLIQNKGIHSGAFAFVTFKYAQSAQKMLGAEVRYKSSLIDCKLTQNYKELEQANAELLKRKIYIGGFDKTLTERDILAIFCQIGKVESILINRDFTSGLSRGSGFVLFASEKSVQTALELVKGEFCGYRFIALPCLKRGQMNRLAQPPFSSNNQQIMPKHLQVEKTSFTPSTSLTFSNDYLRKIDHEETNLGFNQRQLYKKNPLTQVKFEQQRVITLTTKARTALVQSKEYCQAIATKKTISNVTSSKEGSISYSY